MNSYYCCIYLLIIFGIGSYRQIVSADVSFFRCLGCSYSSYAPGNNDCLNATDRISYTVKCNSTSSCTHSEQIDKRTGKVKSVFRSCQVDRGTRCDSDYTDYNCVMSCKSELCNNRTDLWKDIKVPHGGNTAPSLIPTFLCCLHSLSLTLFLIIMSRLV